MIAILTHLVAIDPLQRVEDCGQRQNAERQPLRRVELAQALHSGSHAARGGRHEESSSELPWCAEDKEGVAVVEPPAVSLLRVWFHAIATSRHGRRNSTRLYNLRPALSSVLGART